MDLTAKKMQKALDEINGIFGNEKIDFEGDVNGLKVELKTALELIEEGDTFTEETQAVLDELKAPSEKKEKEMEQVKKILKKKAPEKKEVKKITKPKGPVVIEHDEEDEVNEQEVEIEMENEILIAPPIEAAPTELTVEEIIKGTKKITILEAMVETSPVFKKLVKMIGKFKTVDLMKQAMLDVLEDGAPKTKTIPKKEEKKIKKPVIKAIKPVKEKIEEVEEEEEVVDQHEEEKKIIIDYKAEFERLGGIVTTMSQALQNVINLSNNVLAELENSLVVEKAKKRKGKGRGKGTGTGSTKPGVVNTIAKIVEDAGPEGITRADILEKLCAAFPDREENSMRNTLGAQVPGVISRTRWAIGKHEDGRYFKEEV